RAAFIQSVVGSWEIVRNVLNRHARFSPQLGEKPREYNVLPRTHAPQQLAPIRSQASPRLFCLHLHRSAEVADRTGRDHQIAALHFVLTTHDDRRAGWISHEAL